MFKKIIAFAAILCLSHYAFSQTAGVKGIIRDTTANIAVRNAVVAILTPVDSILVGFTRTGAQGEFDIKNIGNGKYIVMVMHPSFADYVEDIDVNGPVSLPQIAVTPKSKLLADVILKSGSPIRIKGDTTIYTADSFNVSANANVEELLKKLPGIQVDKNGQITAMGQTVEKVLVDGEEFFGDDPGMAVKNLRADAVKEVQVFDKKSDQAEFTGIDDGKTQKTINLKLKEDKKKGYFGKIDIAGGLLKDMENRYNDNLMYSSFRGKRKLSVFLLNGNTGQDGLSWQDNEKFGLQDDNVSMSMDDDGGMMYMWRGGSSDDEPTVNTEDGFIKNLNAGAQYSNKWNDKITLNFSPKYNEQVYSNNKQIFTQEQVNDPRYAYLNEHANSATHVDRHNIKLRGIYDIKLDTSNTLKITANANFYHTNSMEAGNSEKTGSNGDPINRRNNVSTYNSDKYALSGNAIFRHKFKKARRTLSVNADWTLLNTEGTNFINTFNQVFDPSNPYTKEVDQMIDYVKQTNKITTKAVYTEPLNKKLSMEIAHEFSYTKGNNDQITYSKLPGTVKYDQRVDSVSNNFDQTILVNKPSAKLNYSYKKIKFNFGSGFGLTHFNLTDKTYHKDYIRNFTNFFPVASFTYNYKSNHSFRFNYNGYTTQPTINQLQPLRNSTDEFNQYIGNPDLKPSFSNSFNISHNGYDFIKDRWMYQSLNINMTNNAIKYNRDLDFNNGKTTTQPINTDGNISINFWSGVGFKMKKINTRFNVNPHLTYYKSVDMFNKVLNKSQTTNAGLSVYISKSKDKKYDFSLSNDFSHNRNSSSLNNANKRRFNTNTLGGDATVYIKKVWSIQSDFQFYSRQKTAQDNTDLNNKLWNARLQRTFNKNEFTVYVKVRDILKDNIGIERNFSSSVYTETRNDRLQRYWLVGFAWDFKNKGAKAK
jgi:hypothetical protein